ncbi:DUF7504 family protein [Haloprofundus salinisoli]|uniref:DUF7504 family protein n=1 Tax=Haloprofundus salinisoli TaxID=2876193 RepID=UPI001CCFB10C|nr:hypothetical protein [Haloprofundus salinisoli]
MVIDTDVNTTNVPAAGEQTLVRTVDPLPAAALPRTDRLLVVSARLHPQRLERLLRESGRDPASATLLSVWPVELEYDGPVTLSGVVHPGDVTGVGMRLVDALSTLSEGDCVATDALGVLEMYCEPDVVSRFFSTVLQKTSGRRLHGVHTVQPGVAVDGALEAQFDRVVDEPTQSS